MCMNLMQNNLTATKWQVLLPFFVSIHLPVLEITLLNISIFLCKGQDIFPYTNLYS